MDKKLKENLPQFMDYLMTIDSEDYKVSFEYDSKNSSFCVRVLAGDWKVDSSIEIFRFDTDKDYSIEHMNDIYKNIIRDYEEFSK